MGLTNLFLGKTAEIIRRDGEGAAVEGERASREILSVHKEEERYGGCMLELATSGLVE